MPAVKKPTRGRVWLKRLLFILIIDGLLLGLAEAIAGIVRPFYYNRVISQEKLGRVKAPGEKRVFLYGESTIYGVPYGPNNSTALWLDAILHDVLPDVPVRVINFGGPGQGSYHLLDALRSTIDYQPDAVVMCVGHNEFLASPLALVASGPAHRWWYFHCHLYRIGFHAMPSLRERLGASGHSYAGIPSWSERHREVLDFYRGNVEAMITLAEQKHVPFILSMPGCYGPWPPNQSQHFAPMSDQQQQDYATRMEAIRKAVRAGQDADAAIQQALAESDHYAEAHYWHARALEQRGQHDQAYAEYMRSLDLDCLPLRGQSGHVAILQEVAVQRQVPFVNCREVFHQHADGQTPGGRLFIDHCHPRPCGQYLMAAAMARSLCEQGRLAPADQWHWDRLPTYETCLARMRLSPEEWRHTERDVLLGVFPSAPEVVAEATDVLPPLAKSLDDEWQALHLLAMWQCDRQAEVRQAWAKVDAARRAAMDEFAQHWPKYIRLLWGKTHPLWNTANAAQASEQSNIK